MSSPTNPLLSEINSLSPGAKAALMAAHQGASQPPNPTQGMQPPNPAMAGIRAQAAPQGPAPAPMMLPPSQASTVPAMTASAPAVKAPRGTLEGDEAHRTDLMTHKPGLEGVYGKITGGDFGQNHPILSKVLGVAAQVPSTIADIGLSGVAPRVGALVPGTSIQHGLQLGAANKAVTADQAERTAGIANQGAQATTAHTQAETENLRNPPDKFAPLPTANGIQAFDPSKGTATPLTDAQGKPLEPFNPAKTKTIEESAYESLASQGKTPVEILDTIYGSKNTKVEDLPHLYLDALQSGDTAKAALIKKAHEDTQVKPVTPPGVTMIVPNAEGGGTVQRLSPGQTVAPGAQTAAGFNSMSTPTTQQRSAAGRAATVVQMAPEVLKEIDQLAPKLGPIMGRWNEFQQGKVGMDDPDFAGLRTDLVMMSSAVALAHAQGRLPENLRQEFDRMINAPKQTPDNLKATIEHVLPWLQKMVESGQRPNAGTPAPQGNQPAGAATHRWNPATGQIEEIKQ